MVEATLSFSANLLACICLPVGIFLRLIHGSFWKVSELFVFICLPIGLISRLVYGEETDVSAIALSICSIMVWFKILYYMRPFQSSGPLVSMILQIAFDIRFFILIVFFVLAGFAQSFWLLSYHQSEGKFFSIKFTHYYTVMYMLGQDVDPVEFDNSRVPLFSFFLLVLFLVTMMVLMLNLLIAMMQDTYEIVRKKGRAQWRIEQVLGTLCCGYYLTLTPPPLLLLLLVSLLLLLLLEQAEVMLEDVLESKESKQKMIHPYIHVLKYASDVMHDKDVKEKKMKKNA